MGNRVVGPGLEPVRMKKAILIVMALLAAQTVPLAHAEPATWNILLSGGPEANSIQIRLSPDGRDYVIDSVVTLEVGGTVCSHPGGTSNQLVCEAAAVSGFEVNAGAGDDNVGLSPEVPVPVTMRGGPGDDRLAGGAGADKLIGGAGDDVLLGRAGNDSIFGGPGRDRLLGGRGDDLIRGGPGRDVVVVGSGRNNILPRPSAR
jgi:Ca2+-binding RTX toxin-like protein